MGLRLALAVPLAAALMGGVAIALIAAGGTRTGLAEDQRVWFFVMMPGAYLMMHVYVSSLIAAWLVGARRLPAWVRSRLLSGSREWTSDRSALELYAVASPAGRMKIAISVFLAALWLLLLSVPVFSMLIGWLFAPGVYAAWEAAVVIGSACASLVWLVFLFMFIRRQAAA